MAKKNGCIIKKGVLVEYQGNDAHVVIPDRVTAIGDSAFEYCTSLTSITIPSSVRKINDFAFYCCTSLSDVELPSSVTEIGHRAFLGCKNLTNITIDQNNTAYHSQGNCLIETQSQTLVWGCQNSIIPTDGSVVSIGDYAFSGCENLTNIEIPSSIISIGVSAFAYCLGFTSVKMPSNLGSIGDYAFNGCANLTGIEMPSSLTSIGHYAFSNCSGLTSIEIPDSVTEIGEYAFNGCTSLKSITVDSANSVYYSNDQCLIEYQSKSLVFICSNGRIPADGSVISIKDWAFCGYTIPEDIVIPRTVIAIGKNAFLGHNDVVIIAYEDSYAEKFARQQGVNFDLI